MGQKFWSNCENVLKVAEKAAIINGQQLGKSCVINLHQIISELLRKLFFIRTVFDLGASCTNEVINVANSCPIHQFCDLLFSFDLRQHFRTADSKRYPQHPTYLVWYICQGLTTADRV